MSRRSRWVVIDGDVFDWDGENCKFGYGGEILVGVVGGEFELRA